MKQTGQTYYIRVGEKLVVLLELHSVHDSKGQQVHSELDWFQEVHLLEVLQLLQDVIQQRVEQVATSKHQQAAAKATSPSDIITGNSLRLIYTFRKRPGHQICLISNRNQDSKGQQAEKEEDNGDPGMKNYTVFQEKIIVFVCQQKQGNLHGMSKLLKVLGDMGQQTGSQTVSISSYFNRLPPSLQATYAAGQSVDSYCQQGSLSQRSLHSQQSKPPEDIIQNIKLEPHGSLPQTPPSEGRRHAIKTIIKRNELGFTRKRKRKFLRGVDTSAVMSAEIKDQSVKTYSDMLPIKNEADSDIDSECNFSKNERTCPGDEEENGIKYDSVKQSDLCVKKKDFENKKLPKFKFKDKVNNETDACRKKPDSKVDTDSGQDCVWSGTTFSKYQAKTESLTGKRSCNSISIRESAKICNGQPKAPPEKHQQNGANIYLCPSPKLCLSPRTKEISDIDKCIRERHDYVAQRNVGNSPVKVMSIHTIDKVTQSTDRLSKESTKGSSNEKNYYKTHSEKILQMSRQEESNKSGRDTKLNYDKTEALKFFKDSDSKCDRRKCQIEKLSDVEDRNSCIDAAKSVPNHNINGAKSLLGKRKKYDNSDSVEDMFCGIKRDRKSEIDMKDITYTKGKKSYKDVKPNKKRHVTKKASILYTAEDLPDLLPSGTQLMPKLLSQNSSRSPLSHVNISKGSSPLLSHGSPIGSSISPSKGAKLSPSLSQKSPGKANKCSRLTDRSPSLSKNSLYLSKDLQTADKEYHNLNTTTALSNKASSSSSVTTDPCLISVSASSPRKSRISDASRPQTNCTSTQKISSSDSSPFSTSSGYTIKPVNTVCTSLTHTQKGVMGSVTVVSVDAFNDMYKPALDALSSLPGSEELHRNPRTQCSNKSYVGEAFKPRTKVKEQLKNMNTSIGSHCKSQSEEMSSNYSSKEGTVGRLHTLAKRHRKKRQLPDFVDLCTSSVEESSDKNRRIKRKLSDFGHPSASLTGESNKHQRRKRQLPDFADSSNLLTGVSSELKLKSTKRDNELEQKCSLKSRNVCRTLDRKSNEIFRTKLTDSKTIHKSPTRISFLNEQTLGVDTTDLDETKEMEQDHVLLEELADEFRGVMGTLMQEIKSAKHVRDLNEEQLKFLVMSSKKYLRDIFQGKISCERHKLYKEGGKTRRDLNYRIHLGLFTEEQHDIVMESLMSIFCKKHHKYLDYLLRVLLPEMLIKIYMEVHGTSHAETDKIMASVPQNNVSS